MNLKLETTFKTGKYMIKFNIFLSSKFNMFLKVYRTCYNSYKIDII